MITNAAELLLGIILQFFITVLAALNWQFPPQFSGAILLVISLLHTFASFLPFISDIVAIFLILVPTYVIRYVFDVMLWVWSLVPFVGSHTQLPSGFTLDLRRTTFNDRVVDLRSGIAGRSKSPKRKSISDINRG